MNAKDFFYTVAAMRRAQKGFFSTQRGDPAHSQYYSDSKRLEAEVDAEIDRVNRVLAK